MQRQIEMPDLVRTFGNMFVQRPVAPDSTNTFKARALVVLSSGVLTLVATGGILVYGQVPDKSHAATELPPDSLFGENHWVFSPLDGEFEINIGHLSGTALVIGASAKVLADVTLGTSYGIATPTTGTYAGFQVLDPTNTTDKLFQVTGFIDPISGGAVTGDYNPRVRAKLLPSTIQN